MNLETVNQDLEAWFPNLQVPGKEVIHPQVPLRVPCYDLTPIIAHSLAGCLLQEVSLPASGLNNFRGLTGGVYKARERIHRNLLICDY